MSDEEQALGQEIISDAERRAGRVRARAEREAEKIVAEARKEAEAAREQALGIAARRGKHEQEVSSGRVQQELARLRLQVCQEMVDSVRAEAERQLGQLADGPEHRDVLKTLALRAIGAMSGDRFELVLRPQDRDRWGEALAEDVRAAASGQLGRDVEVELSQETLTAIGGLVVRGADGHELADQTFEARLGRLWDRIRAEVAAVLPDVSGSGE